MNATGRVDLVGAGPGAPDLITVRGRRCLRRADVVVYDRLVDPLLLVEARVGAEKVFVGKAPEGRADPSLRSRPSSVPQTAINELLIARARAGLRVVRLKGGDPFVFGRGGEEAAALAAAGVPFAVVPGLTSAVAAPAQAGIPLTHRGVARSVAIVTGHIAASGNDGAAVSAVAGADTVVVLMGLATLASVVDALRSAGRAATTPAAVVAAATTDREEIVVGTLGDIVAVTRRAGLRPPATLVVGDVVSLRQALIGGATPAQALPSRRPPETLTGPPSSEPSRVGANR